MWKDLTHPFSDNLHIKKAQKLGKKLKNVKELIQMEVIRNVGHDEVVEVTTPVLISWNDGKYRLCGDFMELNNYTKTDRYPIQRIPNLYISW
ncbi:hypothetical protein O181_052475 [Austropuccinia psidii MF-1]|uniref:Uncharacterized protein n=1 Tax=Austropuccinia psidii MF-1 TaxID=1389203 RepID=A0A9Q3DYX8_9BASI|nr:hypothetical protein [Austropuccinia psidii MF-1]